MPGLLVPCNYSVLNCCFLLLNKPMSEKVQEVVEREREGRQGWRGCCRDIWHQSCGNHQCKQTWLKNYIRAALPAVTNCSCKSLDVPPIHCPLGPCTSSPTLPTLATASAAPVSWYVLSCYLVTLYGCTSYCCCCCCCCPCGTNQSIEFLYPFLYCAQCWFCALFN